MRFILAGLAAISLGACGAASQGNNSASEANNVTDNAENVAQPQSDVPAADQVQSNDATAAPAGSEREQQLAECTREANEVLPAGTNIAALCGCAVDRAPQSGEFAAMRACAAEQNVELPRVE